MAFLDAKMKIKNVLLLSAMGLTVAALSGAALAIANPAKEVKAAKDDRYYLTGTMNEWKTTGWNDASDYNAIDGGDEIYITFQKDAEFKFRLAGTWDGALGDSALRGTARGYFVDANGGAADGNIKCLVGGFYQVSIKDSLLYIDLYNPYSTDVYFQLNSPSWEHNYIYVYDEESDANATLEPFGAFPGIEITNITNGVNFAPNYSAGGGLGKVTLRYKSLAKTKLIFSNGDGLQTQNLPLGQGYYYLQNTTAIDGVSAKGPAAKVVFEWDHALAEATDQSLCNLSVEKATELITLYNQSSGLAFVQDTNFWTWKDNTKTDKKNFTGVEVLETLNAIKDGTLALTYAPASSDSLPLWIALGSLALGGAAFAFFYVRKKKVTE